MWSLLKLVYFVGLIIVSLAMTLELVSPLFLQIFAWWLLLLVVIKTTLHLEPHPGKLLFFAVMVMVMVRLVRFALENESGNGDFIDKLRERFGADCDIWADPEKIIDKRIENVLDKVKQSSHEMEDFLHTSVPNARSIGTKSDEAEAMIV